MCTFLIGNDNPGHCRGLRQRQRVRRRSAEADRSAAARRIRRNRARPERRAPAHRLRASRDDSPSGNRRPSFERACRRTLRRGVVGDGADRGAHGRSPGATDQEVLIASRRHVKESEAPKPVHRNANHPSGWCRSASHRKRRHRSLSSRAHRNLRGEARHHRGSASGVTVQTAIMPGAPWARRARRTGGDGSVASSPRIRLSGIFPERGHHCGRGPGAVQLITARYSRAARCDSEAIRN